MSEKARPTTTPRRPAGLSRTSAAAAVCAVVVCVAGIVLAGLGGPTWTTPTTQRRPTPADPGAGLASSHGADAHFPPARRGTTATAPDPVLLALLRTVRLTPTRLRLSSTEPELELTHPPGPVVGTTRDDRVGLAGRSVDVSTLRLGLGGVSAGILGVLCWAVTAKRRPAGNEPWLGPRRYGGLLLEVEPVVSPAGRPAVEVADLSALVTLARRHGVLVMYWTRSRVRTFVVHHDGVAFRYRVHVAPGTTSSRRRVASDRGTGGWLPVRTGRTGRSGASHDHLVGSSDHEVRTVSTTRADGRPTLPPEGAA